MAHSTSSPASAPATTNEPARRLPIRLHADQARSNLRPPPERARKLTSARQHQTTRDTEARPTLVHIEHRLPPQRHRQRRRRVAAAPNPSTTRDTEARPTPIHIHHRLTPQHQPPATTCRSGAELTRSPQDLAGWLSRNSTVLRAGAERTTPLQDPAPAATRARPQCDRPRPFADKSITAAEKQLRTLAEQCCPGLLELPGVGPITAATLLTVWSHHGRVHSEAAFAALRGISPLPASSGRIQRHRLNRGGDRALNRAIHTVATTRRRMKHTPTSDYITRRTTEGLTDKEILRCLKRYTIRQLYRFLQTHTATTP